MGSLERLISESRKLEETAGRIQNGTHIGLSREEIEAFVLVYRNWFAECLPELSSVQEHRFRNEYEGDDEHDPKIREFLADPTALWEPTGLKRMSDLLRDEMLRGLGKRGMPGLFAAGSSLPYWKYPYKDAFYPYLLNQRQILLEASKYRSRGQTHEHGESEVFDAREFHLEVRECSRSLFVRGEYEAAVFESSKAFVKYVQMKSRSNLSGFRLMKEVLSQHGSLRLNSLQTEAQRDEQEGLKHLCMGLVSAIRNPGGHELARDRHMSKEDALDILSFISFLFRQIDRTSYFRSK